MRITLVGSTDLPELLPLVRAYCDFYQVTPSDRELLELSRALLADPEREGLQLLARDDAGSAVGFATLYWSWQTLVAARVTESSVFLSRHADRASATVTLRRSLPGTPALLGAFSFRWANEASGSPRRT